MMRTTSPSVPTTGRAFMRNAVVIRALAAQAEFLIDRRASARAWCRDRRGNGPVRPMHDIEPGRGRPSRAPRASQLCLDLGTDMDMVGRHVPVEIVSPLPVRASALRSVSATPPPPSALPAKAFCIIVNPISMTMSTRPPIKAGETRSLVNVPVTVKAAPMTQISSKNKLEST